MQYVARTKGRHQYQKEQSESKPAHSPCDTTLTRKKNSCTELNTLDQKTYHVTHHQHYRTVHTSKWFKNLHRLLLERTTPFVSSKPMDGFKLAHGFRPTGESTIRSDRNHPDGFWLERGTRPEGKALYAPNKFAGQLHADPQTGTDMEKQIRSARDKNT